MPKFYPVTAIRDESSSNIVTFPYKTASYYQAEDALLNYREAVTLFGIRRTGKSTVLQQLWNEYRTQESVYLTLNGELTIEHLLNYLERYEKIDLLFLDEITRVVDLDSNFHALLDHYKLVGTKILCAGTDSYLIALSQRDTAFGRLELIRFLPILFEDLKAIEPANTFKKFCLNGRFFTSDNQRVALAENIFNSIDKSSLYKHVLRKESPEDIEDAIMLIVEMLLGYQTNKLPSLKIKLGYSKYIIEDQQLFTVQPLTKEAVNTIFNILITLDVIQVIPRCRIVAEDHCWELESVDRMFYVALPALYQSVLSKLSGLTTLPITAKQLGVLFEATAITQIGHKLMLLEFPERAYSIFSLRDDVEQYEVDLCTLVDDTLSLIEFKVNSKKSGKHFYHPRVQGYAANYERVNYYVVYLEGEPTAAEGDVKYVQIEEFLSNLADYVT